MSFQSDRPSVGPHFVESFESIQETCSHKRPFLLDGLVFFQRNNYFLEGEHVRNGNVALEPVTAP